MTQISRNTMWASAAPSSERSRATGFVMPRHPASEPSVDRDESRTAFRTISGQDGNSRDAFTPSQLVAALAPALKGSNKFTRQNFADAFSGLGVRPDLAENAFDNLSQNRRFLPASAVVNLANQFADPRTGNWNLAQFRNVLNAVADAGARPPNEPAVDRREARTAFGTISGQDGNPRDAFTPAQLVADLTPALTMKQGVNGFTRPNFVNAFSGLGVRPDLATNAFNNLTKNGNFLPADAVVNLANQFADPRTKNWNLGQFTNVLNAVADAGATPRSPMPDQNGYGRWAQDQNLYRCG